MLVRLTIEEAVGFPIRGSTSDSLLFPCGGRLETGTGCFEIFLIRRLYEFLDGVGQLLPPCNPEKGTGWLPSV